MKDTISAGRLRGTSTLTRNPFSTEGATTFPNLSELIEKEYGQVMPVLALVGSIITWGLLYSLPEEFNEYVKELDRFREATIGFVIITFLVLGVTFMRNLIKNLGNTSDLYDSKDPQIILQRAKTVVTTYLSFILGALVFTFLSDVSLELKIVRYAPISFILGSIFYLLLRQRPENSKVAKLFFAVVQSPNLELRVEKTFRGSDGEYTEYFSEKIPDHERETQVLTKHKPAEKAGPFNFSHFKTETTEEAKAEESKGDENENNNKIKL